jgi:D-alanine-D-alanine ligase
MRTAYDRKIVLVASKPRRPQGGYKNLVSSPSPSKQLANRMLLRALRHVDREVFYYDDLREFVANIDTHQDHLIFPYYYSYGSRINYSRVQSICESLGVRFVGPDAYVLTVCTDKVLSKDICRSQGLSVPRCAVYYARNDRPPLDTLQGPLIVKPVFEGDSRGVTRDSICSGPESAEARALALFTQIEAPVMVEEFVEGLEVNVCLLQDQNGGYSINAVALKKSGPVYDHKQKHFGLPFNRYRSYQEREIEQNSEVFLGIAKLLGKVEFLRIDCIVREGKIYCIELTPDADLSVTSALYRSVAAQMDYSGFIRLLVDNATESYRSRSPN